MEYLKRIADEQLNLLLEAFGAVQIKGPKWCGKTTTATQRAKSVLQLQDADFRDSYLTTAQTAPSLLLKGAVPRLLDEWQDAPRLWDAVRMEVDRRQAQGQFILTGSTVVDDSCEKEPSRQRMHTGIGRIAPMTMLPMSLWESRESTGDVSLKRLFADGASRFEGAVSRMNIEQLIHAACRGGWPGTLSLSERGAMQVARTYHEIICTTDIQRVDKVRRNPTLTRLILRSYARNICTLAKKTQMLADVQSEMETTSMNTFEDYVDALHRLYVLEDIDAWCPAIRSRAVMRSGKKRNFVDPSIAIAALGLSDEALEMDLRTFGFMFECMCARDLRVYSQSLGGHLSYYHDRYGLEADLVLHLNDGRYALMECKLGSHEIEDGARHLLEIRRLIRERNQTEKQAPLREPDLMMILTGGQFAYLRDDGVFVIPLATLKD